MEQKHQQRVHLAINTLIILQSASAAYFLGDFVTDIFEDDDSALHVFLEAIAVICLFVGAYLSLKERSRLLERNELIEAQLQMASGAFHELLQGYFDRWELTPSEREIALFTLKGFSNAEIAELRHTKEGTVKAQSNAIFRKAGVTGRTQLLSHFIEELINDPILGHANGQQNTTGEGEFDRDTELPVQT